MASAPEDVPRAADPGAPRRSPPPFAATLVLGALALIALCAPHLGPYLMDFLGRTLVLAIFAMSLQFLVGSAGLVSLGHAAFYGVGAYATVLAAGTADVSVVWLLPLAMTCAALAALVVGALSLRTTGVYFIMVTLAFAQMAYFVVHDSGLAGGSDGLYLGAHPRLGAIDLAMPRALFYTVVGATLASYGALTLLRRSRFGAALAGIRVNEQRMRAVGFATYAYRLAAFVVAGALAGLAGSLVALRDGVVTPDMMAWHVSGEVLVVIILGGIGRLEGAVLGALVFTLLRELLSNAAVVGPVAAHWQLALGLCIIAFVALLPKGLAALPARVRGVAP